MNNKQELIKLQQDKQRALDYAPIGQFTSQQAIQNRAISLLGKDRALKFLAGITSAVTNNNSLSECSNTSIFNGALLGESLGLSPSPQLGQYFLVPFNDKEKGKVAQFQLGYKGYLQLAIRSGYYKKINVLDIKEGELIKYNPLDEEIEVNLIENEEQREKTKTIGYYAMFEYTNGFKKTIYWSKSKMQEHAKKYSPGYKSDLNKSTTYTFWSKDFDGMAFKTMLRQLISKWGIMSVEMQNAIEKDMGVIKEDGSVDYVDNNYQEQDDNSVAESNVENVIPEANVENLSSSEEEVTPKQVDMNALFNN